MLSEETTEGMIEGKIEEISEDNYPGKAK